MLRAELKMMGAVGYIPKRMRVAIQVDRKSSMLYMRTR
jgi:hypothetical protein